MKRNNLDTEYSYFKGVLLAELKANHPDKLIDLEFISERTLSAEILFEDARRAGKNAIEAEEIVTEALFRGLHFSKFITIKNVLINEFPDRIEPENIDALALLLIFKFRDIFDRYPIEDDFGEKPVFARLYTELTGAIHFYFVDYGI